MMLNIILKKLKIFLHSDLWEIEMMNEINMEYINKSLCKINNLFKY